MAAAVQIVDAEGAASLAMARALVGEYAAWLAIDLEYQNFERELATLKRFTRMPDLPPKPIDNVLVSEWVQAKAILKQAESNEETCRRFVVAELGDGEVGECEIGRITYKLSQRAGYTVAPTTVRTLRFSKR